MELLPLFLILVIASIAYFSLWFIVGQRIKRLDVLDSAWGLGFIYLSILALLISESYSAISIAAVIFVSVWGLRMFAHITSRNIKKDEDFRYKAYRTKWNTNFTLKVFVRLYLAQALGLFVINLAAVSAIIGNDHYIPIAYFGFIVWGFGILYETLADYQLRQFIKFKNNPKEVMDRGLWRYSRHPNYFGEITAWLGAGLVGLSAGNSWGLIGSFSIYFFLTRVTGVPLLEKKYDNNQNYKNYKKRTSTLIPLPPKK
jgi:steroid 5-alpha reductase family enzyme